jgi:hypothetical protein
MRQYVPTKHYTTTRLHGARTQKSKSKTVLIYMNLADKLSPPI